MDVPVGNLPRLLRAPLDDRLEQLAMLAHQHVAGFAALCVHAADVGHHVALEQIEQPLDGVQQHGVVAGLGDRQMEARVGQPFLGAVARRRVGVALLQRLESLAQALVIHRRGALRRIVGAGALQGMAELQQVALRLLAAAQQFAAADR